MHKRGTVQKMVKTKSGHRIIRIETRNAGRSIAARVLNIQPAKILPAKIEPESDVGKLAEDVARALECGRFPREFWDAI